jgi:4'-phosphopantetheinyl transferase
LPERITIGEDAWAQGPSRPLLTEGAVHVWRADLATVDKELLELLSPDERARAERLSRRRDAQPWARSRGVLRALLGLYLQTDPSRLRFATGAHGKPAFLEEADESPVVQRLSSVRSPRLSFNLSHSGSLALYAFALKAAVGVDVELARRPIDVLAVAARVFGEAEAARLQGLDPVSREREFLRAWVRHEAELKCLGVGIGGAQEAGIGGAQQAGVSGRRPWIAELEVAPRAAAAVAVETPPHELRCWDWPARAGAPSG